MSPETRKVAIVGVIATILAGAAGWWGRGVNENRYAVSRSAGTGAVLVDSRTGDVWFFDADSTYLFQPMKRRCEKFKNEVVEH